jgi:hypothetical protein
MTHPLPRRSAAAAPCPADPRLPPPPSPNHAPCPADPQLSPPPAPHHVRLASPNHGVGGVLERRGEAVLGRQAVVHGRHDCRGSGGQRRTRVVEWRGGRAEQDVAANVEVDDQRQPAAVVTAGPGRHEEAEARVGGGVERYIAGVDHNAARPLLVLHRHELLDRCRGEEPRFPVAVERAVRVQADLKVLIRVHCAHLHCTAQ